MPSDTEVVTMSRTIGQNQLVEELSLKFAHTFR